MKKAQLLVSIFILQFITFGVYADSLNGQLMVYVPKAEIMNAGDSPDHSLLLAQLMGLMTLENGEVATLTGSEVVDYNAGENTFFGYMMMKFKDESTVSFRFEGEENPDTGAYQGSLLFTAGSGRYTGIKGKGKINGQNYEEIAGSHAIIRSTYKIKK
ncbi:MAG: hypothetical protein GKR93_00735 [Gammaproteobacteria bacterium]|nr:hypothetical protein [Gammaproteobacteria bacterium]